MPFRTPTDPMHRAPAQRTAAAPKAAAKPKGLGALPEWNLTDLYRGITGSSGFGGRFDSWTL